jgi:hypothetical protein
MEQDRRGAAAELSEAVADGRLVERRIGVLLEDAGAVEGRERAMVSMVLLSSPIGAHQPTDAGQAADSA